MVVCHTLNFARILNSFRGNVTLQSKQNALDEFYIETRMLLTNSPLQPECFGQVLHINDNALDYVALPQECSGRIPHINDNALDYVALPQECSR
ncbi:hypothetical protein QL285_021715 [Trifolium repens]|nr:hypothetical protein QL285_021715 [Trifolium repens]